MNERLRMDWIKIIAAFSISTLIFISGLSLGNYFSDMKLEKINDLEQDFRSDTMALELRYDILAEDPCIASNSSFLSEELYELGSKLEHMENTLGVDNPNVVRLKDYYSILQLKHWLFMKNIKKECDLPMNLIVYFYSNDASCENCDTQGVVLSYLRKKYQNVRTYAFDYDSNNLAVGAVKDIYIKDGDLPAFIVNDDVYFGFKNADDLVSLFDTYELGINKTEINLDETCGIPVKLNETITIVNETK